MALSFPLSLSAFADTLRIATHDFDLGGGRIDMETGGGEIIPQAYGTRLWGGSVTVTPAYHADQARVEAVLRALMVPGRRFRIGDMANRAPASDPGGLIIGSESVTILDVQAGGSQVKFQGVPSGYEFGPGDYVSFGYNTNYQALHQIASSGTAAPSTETPWLDVLPAIRPGWATATDLRFVDTFMSAMVAAGTSRAGTRSPLISAGVSFDFRQTLRA